MWCKLEVRGRWLGSPGLEIKHRLEHAQVCSAKEVWLFIDKTHVKPTRSRGHIFLTLPSVPYTDALVILFFGIFFNEFILCKMQ